MGDGSYRLSISDEESAGLFGTPSYNLNREGSKTHIVGAPQQITLYVGAAKVPQVRFKDLEAMVTSQIIRDQISFSYRIEFVRATNATTLTRILVDISSYQAISARDDGKPTIGFEAYGRISKPSGRIVESFERSISDQEKRDTDRPNPNDQVDVALEPGPHRLAIAVKDVLNNKTGLMYTKIRVPAYDEIGVTR